MLSSLGMAVNRFYCCGRLASVKLILALPDQNDVQAKTKDNCCKNERQSLKIKDTHFSTDVLTLDVPMPAVLPEPIRFSHVNLFTERAVVQSYQANAPPGQPETPIYILNCTYRI